MTYICITNANISYNFSLFVQAWPSPITSISSVLNKDLYYNMYYWATLSSLILKGPRILPQ